jgi:hypothetical protein
MPCVAASKFRDKDWIEWCERNQHRAMHSCRKCQFSKNKEISTYQEEKSGEKKMA